MLGFCVLLYGLALLLPVLAALPLLGMYKGCRFCHRLMWRPATKCPSCHEWVTHARVDH
jgi:hypothetical protein